MPGLLRKHLALLFVRIKFAIWQLFHKQDLVRVGDTLSVLETLDPELKSSLSARSHDLTINKLQAYLRQVPWWRRGHIQFAQFCLEIDDIAAAYASAQAAVHLAGSAREELEAKELLAECYLRRGAAEQAREIYGQLVEAVADVVSYREGLAAAYIALGDRENAKTILSGIPEQERSSAAQMALDGVSISS